MPLTSSHVASPTSTSIRLRALAAIVLGCATFAACGSDRARPEDPITRPVVEPGTPVPVLFEGELGIYVVASSPRSPAISLASADLIESMGTITGVEPTSTRIVDTAPDAPAIVLATDPSLEELMGTEGYRIRMSFDERHPQWLIEAATDVGVLYGAHELIADIGVRYFHPEQTFYPGDPDLALRTDFDGAIRTPHFRWRGFHEHTQHPIEMSDYLLRPEAEFRHYVTRYLRWYARNRQNTLSWHMLKTVDQDAWLPYISGIIEEAAGLGVEVGMVLSFVDEQQNNFKIVDEDILDPDTGLPVADDIQIRDTLDRLAAAGFRFFALQIGSSEFTKPDDDRIVAMMDLAAEHLAAMDPPIRSYAWIHTTCSLKADDGSYFFHTPSRATETLGAWVHTTMFYTLDLPAPVYDCESFSHHLDFLESEHQRREQIYFPETAWWLGFDNNTPITLPITGWSRHHDIANVLAPYDMTGHVTFTTGREWLYWQYDHHLTRTTWDAAVDWESYMRWLAPIYGTHGDVVADVLIELADLQVEHFYQENPEIFFYYAGELQQDEIGEQAGIIARRPKIALRRVVEMDDETFAAWRTDDYEMLERMHAEYRTLFERLPASQGLGSTLSAALYHEVWEAMRISTLRLEHALLIYGGTATVREFAQLSREGEVDADARLALLDEATASLDAARAISDDVIRAVAVVEGGYRYPLDILAELKPETLTSYPFGYLWETRTGHFWTRRDDQLAALIEDQFETVPETWSVEPEILRIAVDDDVTLVEPSDPLARSVIGSFIPQLLFGITDDDALLFAQDDNRNLLPDRGTEARVEGTRDGDTWSGSLESYLLVVRDDAGAVLGELVLVEPAFTLVWEDEVPVSATIAASFPSRALVDLILQNFGIDEAGVVGLVKSVFGIERQDPLPTLLPVVFDFALREP